MSVERHFDGHADAWTWIVPHPADPRPGGRRGVQSRIGTGSLDAFHPVLELRSKPGRFLGGWSSELLDVTGRRARRAGKAKVLTFAGGGRQMRSARCTLDGAVAEFDLEGRFALDGVEDHCTMATRGKPPPGPRRRGQDAAERRRRRREAQGVDDVVTAPVTAFDGWLTATQHRTAVGEAVAEAWHIRIDRARPQPGPVALALSISCAALCHRAAMGTVPSGVLDLLGE